MSWSLGWSSGAQAITPDVYLCSNSSVRDDRDPARIGPGHAHARRGDRDRGRFGDQDAARCRDLHVLPARGRDRRRLCELHLHGERRHGRQRVRLHADHRHRPGTRACAGPPAARVTAPRAGSGGRWGAGPASAPALVVTASRPTLGVVVRAWRRAADRRRVTGGPGRRGLTPRPRAPRFSHRHERFPRVLDLVRSRRRRDPWVRDRSPPGRAPPASQAAYNAAVARCSHGRTRRS